jgi:hypothetical protein
MQMPNHDTNLTTSMRPQSRSQVNITGVLEGEEPQIVPVEEPVEEQTTSVDEEVVNDGSFGMLGQRFEQRERELEASETNQQEASLPSALEGTGITTVPMQPEEEEEDESWFSSLFNNVASFFGKDSEESNTLPNDIIKKSEEIKDLINDPTSDNTSDSLVERRKNYFDQDYKVPTNKIIELGYLIRQTYRSSESNREQIKIISGLTETNGMPTINKFYDQAVGKKSGLDASNRSVSWCAAFVNHILTELGADTLGKKTKYQRVRAKEYLDYGKGVDFEGIQEGDLVVMDYPKDKNGNIDYRIGKRDGIPDHVAFYAGNKIAGDQDPNNIGFINVIGGNQYDPNQPTSGGDNYRLSDQIGVSVKRNQYRQEDIMSGGIRRITYKGDAWQITQDQKDADPIFEAFADGQQRPSNFNPTTNKTYAQGGLSSMDNQMAFALGGDTQGMAETVDPISGNDVPPGSLPVEVRDDIDAKLSEGEYVVPADVVRFFGVKYFEDLRAEAKMGLQQMDEDGRIGGEPVPMDGPEDMALNESDMGDLDNMLTTGVASGGLMDKIAYTLKNDKSINERANAKGISVGYAEGGLNIGADPTQVDMMIERAIRNPTIMKMVADKLGNAQSTTTATMQPKEMQGANPAKQVKTGEVAVNKGGLMGYDNGGLVSEDDSYDFENFDTYAYRDYIMSRLDSGGNSSISLVMVTAPDGTKIPLYWNDDVPLPPGYTLTNAPAAAGGAAAPAAGAAGIPEDPLLRDNSNRDLPEKEQLPKPIPYSSMTDQKLADALAGNIKFTRGFQGMLVSPFAPIAVIGMVGASYSNKQIKLELQKRLKSMEDVDSRPENHEARVLSIKNVMSGKNSDGSALDTRGILSKLFDLEQTKNIAGENRGFLGNALASVIDKFGNTVEQVEEQEIDPDAVVPEDRAAFDDAIAAGADLTEDQLSNALNLTEDATDPSFFDIFTGKNRTQFTREDGSVGFGNQDAIAASEGKSGFVADSNGVTIRARDILGGFGEDYTGPKGAEVLYADATGRIFTKDFLGRETFLKDESNKIITTESERFKDFQTGVSNPSGISALNPAGLSAEMYKYAIDSGMNPRAAPDFGDDWIAYIPQDNSNYWGRKWNKNKDGSLIIDPSDSSTFSPSSGPQQSDGSPPPALTITPASVPSSVNNVINNDNEKKVKASIKRAKDKVTAGGVEKYDKTKESTNKGGTTAGGADLDSAFGITGLNKGGLISKPKKKSYDKGGYVTSKETKQRKKGLASRS